MTQTRGSRAPMTSPFFGLCRTVGAAGGGPATACVAETQLPLVIGHILRLQVALNQPKRNAFPLERSQLTACTGDFHIFPCLY